MIESLLVFAAFTVLGLYGMAPSVTFGDSGEFAAAAASLALPHSPGYPVFVLMAKALGTMIPWGNWAFRTNLLSVLMGAGALSFLVRAFREMGLSRWAAVGGVLFLGLSPLWRYETSVTEVFALNALALSCVLWLTVRYSDRLWEPRPMAALGLVFGLGLGNHHTLVLVIPAVAYQVWRSWDKEKAQVTCLGRGVLMLVLFLILGMLTYAYLPIRSLHNPPLDWGDPTNLSRFFRVLLRKDYGSLSLTVDGPSALARWQQVPRYFLFTLSRFGWTPFCLGALGFAAWPLLKLRIGWEVPLLWISFSGPLFLVLGNPSGNALITGALERFYLASWIGIAALIAAGVQVFINARGPWAALLLTAGVITGMGTSREWSARGDFAAYDYGRSILKSLPKHSSLFIDGGDDTFYTLAFLRFAEGLRPDLDIHDRGGLVFRTAYGADFRSIGKENKEARRLAVERPLAIAGRLYYSTLRERLLPGFRLDPHGLLRRPIPLNAGDQPGTNLWAVYPLRWSRTLLDLHYRDRALVAFYPVMRAAALRHEDRNNDARMQLRRAWDMAPDALWVRPNLSYTLSRMGFEQLKAQRWEKAEQTLAFGQEVAPAQPYFPMHLGVTYEKMGRLDDAEKAYLQAMRLQPDWVKAHHNLGTLYWQQKRWEDAARVFERASSLAPQDTSLAKFAAVARRKAEEKP